MAEKKKGPTWRIFRRGTRTGKGGKKKKQQKNRSLFLLGGWGGGGGGGGDPVKKKKKGGRGRRALGFSVFILYGDAPGEEGAGPKVGYLLRAGRGTAGVARRGYTMSFSERFRHVNFLGGNSWGQKRKCFQAMCFSVEAGVK